MSEIKVDSLTGNATAGNVTITSEGGSATMQLQQGVAKVWCENATDAVTQDSFNVSSSADTTTGKQTLTFTNNFSNSDHANAIISFDADGVAYVDGKSTSQSRWQNYDEGGSGFTDAPIEGVIHGDLA